MKQFLQHHKIKKGDQFTHTTLGNFPGAYNIPLNEYDKFIDLYYTHVFEKKLPSHITEKHQDGYSPILIDLDLRFKGILQDRVYNQQFIEEFLKIYISELNKLVSINDEKLKAFVMEKPTINPVKEKNITKDGVHIVFPYCVLESSVQHVARYNTIKNKDCIALFKSLNVSNSVSDIFDKCVISTNNWFMYGSSKPKSTKYLLTSILGFDKNLCIHKIDIKEYNDKQLISLMSIRNKEGEKQLLTEEEKGPIMEQLEQISKIEKTKTPRKKKILKSKNNVKNTVDDNEFKIVANLVDILSSNRVESYDDWIRLGWCLHNIDYRLIDKWVDISKKSPKYVDGECQREWDLMDNEGLGMGSLCKWAKEDNILKYNEIMKDNLHKVMLDSLNATHHDIAKVVYKMFKYEFVCASAKKGVWYHFKNHRWNELDDAIELKQKISKDVVNEYYKLNSVLSNKASELDSSSYEKEIILARCKQIMQIITKLKTNSFKKSVISECSELFHVHKFEEKLDTKVNLIGFTNGVYDLEYAEFRDGIPEDYISFSTHIDYVPLDVESEDVEDVLNVISQILPIKSVRNYVLRLLSSFLSGKTGHEKFHIWTGCGGNGKSKLIELFRLGFGDYCTTLPITIITEKRARAEGANPALAKTKGKRFACLQEPENDEKINVGLMKELTGGDTIEARGLYKDPIEFKPQFKLVLTCNDLPTVNANDRGTWRRIRLVEFISKFVEEPSQNPKDYEFLIDEELDDKLQMWCETFMSILIEEHKSYRHEGIKEPDAVKLSTKQYQNESDEFTQFINENIVSGDDYNGQELKLDDIYFVFQEWFKQSKGQNVKVPLRRELQKNLEKKFGKTKGNKAWAGISLKHLSNDESNDLDMGL